MKTHPGQEWPNQSISNQVSNQVVAKTIEELRAAAEEKGAKQPKRVLVSEPREVTERSEEVKQYAQETERICSKEKCEYCSQPARYRKNGKPRFTIHHPSDLALGGEDTIYNVARICFDCHDAAHHSDEAEKINRILLQRIAVAEGVKAPEEAVLIY